MRMSSPKERALLQRGCGTSSMWSFGSGWWSWSKNGIQSSEFPTGPCLPWKSVWFRPARVRFAGCAVISSQAVEFRWGHWLGPQSCWSAVTSSKKPSLIIQSEITTIVPLHLLTPLCCFWRNLTLPYVLLTIVDRIPLLEGKFYLRRLCFVHWCISSLYSSAWHVVAAQ